MSRLLCPQSLSDAELLERLSTLVARQRRVESDVVAHIAEVDARKLFLDRACSSMHAYCCEVLHLSEAEAYLRITCARLSRRFPVVLDMLADGRLHLSAIAKLAPHLTDGNAEALLQRAAHKSKREVEVLVAEVAPRPDVPSRMRKLPCAPSGRSSRGPAPGGDATTARSECMPLLGPSAPGELRPDRASDPFDQLRPDAVPAPCPRPAVLEPIAPARYKVEFTAGAELRDKLCRALALLRHKYPDGDLGEVIDEALTLLLGKLEARRFGKTEAPRKSLADTDTSVTSRHVPAAVKRAVYERDQGQCAFVDPVTGKRCSCTDPGKLEYHHITPFARGSDHDPDRLELRCHAHNQQQAELDFGVEKMARHRNGSSRARESAAAYWARGGQGACRACRPCDCSPPLRATR